MNVDQAVALVESAEPRSIESIEAKMLDWPQVECPLTHYFPPGVYLREIFMPAGSIIIGHEHKTRHVNLVLTGKALVMVNGHPFMLEAPNCFESEPGVRKVLFILEDMRFTTVHANPDNETDLDKLAERLIVKSPTFLQYHEDIARLKECAQSL